MVLNAIVSIRPMNHGYCKNCWWWHQVKSHSWTIENASLVEHKAHGICLMHSNTICDFYDHANEDGYCPDYTNRKRTNREQKLTLEQWMASMDIVIPDEEKVVKRNI